MVSIFFIFFILLHRPTLRLTAITSVFLPLRKTCGLRGGEGRGREGSSNNMKTACGSASTPTPTPTSGGRHGYCVAPQYLRTLEKGYMVSFQNSRSRKLAHRFPSPLPHTPLPLACHV